MHEFALILENRKNAIQLVKVLKAIHEDVIFSGSELVAGLPCLSGEKKRTLLLLLKINGILVTIKPAPSVIDYLMKVNGSKLEDFERQIMLILDVLPEKSRADKKEFKEKIKIVATMPDLLYSLGGFQHVPSVSSAMAKLITQAEKTIWIVNPFFDESATAFLLMYLDAAASRRVKINVITRPLGTNDSNANSIRFLKDNLKFPEQLEVKSFYSARNDEWCSIHSKILLIDETACYIGSANITQSSFHNNFEIGLILTGEIVKEPANIIKTLWEIAHYDSI